MKKYRAKFRGRKAGAIGINYQIETFVFAESEADAQLKIYDEYEHIMFLEITLV